LGDEGVDGIILRWIYNKYDARVLNGFNWIRTGTNGGL